VQPLPFTSLHYKQTTPEFGFWIDNEANCLQTEEIYKNESKKLPGLHRQIAGYTEEAKAEILKSVNAGKERMERMMSNAKIKGEELKALDSQLASFCALFEPDPEEEKVEDKEEDEEDDKDYSDVIADVRVRFLQKLEIV